MFGIGDLFQEEGDKRDPHTGSKVKEKSESGSSDSVPVSPRLACGLSGINNQGATCYMNSLLQTLVMTPEFRDSLFKLSSDELGKLQDKEHGGKVRVIPIQLQRLFARLFLLNAQGVDTTELTTSFGWTNNEQFVQHDVQELNRILFSAVEDSLHGTSGQHLIRELYHGSIVNQIKCLTCSKISEREEDFLDLSVAVAGSSGLEYSLANSYVETESLSGKNQYYCDSCCKLVDAEKGAKLRHLPPILTLSLLRFSFDFQKMERFKETGKFTFPMELDMSPFVDYWSGGTDAMYELFSVIVHGGGAHGGHYTAYIRDIDSLGTWSHPDIDEIQLIPDPSSGKVDFIECDSPVELVHAILQRTSQKSMKVDTLCAELMKQTGVSWNKRFKRQHGPIIKFLKNHDDRFELNPDVNWVSLRHTDPASHEKSPSECIKESSNHTKKSGGKHEPLSPAPENGCCWFHFNDSRVYPVRTEELQSKYSGRVCSYMLFYRRKSMQRPPAAKHNPQYMVPLELLGTVCEENVKLEEQRIKYEMKINTITVKLLFGQFFKYEHGALQPKDTDMQFLELSIDKRKKISDLISAIKEVYEEVAQPDFVIHLAKLHQAGVHIYECVSNNTDITISDAKIPYRSRLLVWDGQQIEGEKIPIGADKEPVQLDITYGDSSQLSCAFPKSLTMGELRIMLCDMTKQDLNHVVLNRIIPEAENSKLFKVLPEDYGKTLEEIGVNNGEQIVLENMQNTAKSITAEQALQSHSKHISFVVENRCSANKDGEWSLYPVQVEKKATVAELKTLILSKLCLECEACRLRVEHDSLGLLPPLYEGQNIEAAGLSQGTHLILELGQAPKNDQLSLNITTNTTSPDVEVMLSRTASIEECLKVIVNSTNNMGDNWHLRKVNWCGEAAGVLDDPDATLEECQVKNGDQLLLEEGQLPPKGFVKIPILLYPPPNQQHGVKTDVLSTVIGKLQSMIGLGEISTDSKDGHDLGEVIISKEATLEELKMTIMTLPAMETVSLPMIEFIRVSVVEQKHLTRVLRDHNQTLQRLKVTSGMRLGTQVLSHEEQLNENHILLNVQCRIPETKSYNASVELQWNISQGASPDNLKQAVADLLALPAERIVLAKHMPDKFDWITIEMKPATSNPGKSQKGKKKGTAKCNLKHSPYFIKDGDVIAVKDLEFDPGNVDDFSTESDIEGREKLTQEAEDRRKRREELRRANAALGNFSKQRQEVGIKIHVENFR